MLTFNQLLTAAGIDPADVRLLRHLPEVGGKSLLDLWRNDAAVLEGYQSLQPVSARQSFARRYWASFVGTWDGRTVFVGMYEVHGREELEPTGTDPVTHRIYESGSTDRYRTTLAPVLRDLAGRLFIEWGGGASGKRAWNQRADYQDKGVTELLTEKVEEPFPGFLSINKPLTFFDTAPPAWIEQLSRAKGVYLLSCPRDGSRYVGSATGDGGFWARWSEYRSNQHGGNTGLRTRDPSDYHATILEVAGSTATKNEIVAAEMRWMDKLQTRKWGLNR